MTETESMVERVFIVYGEYGNCDTLTYGLCGVFSNRPEAEEYAADLRTRSAAFREWHDRLCKEIDKRRPPFGTPFNSAEHDVIVAEAKKHVPPDPGYVAGERFEIVEVGIGEKLGWIMLL